MSQEEDNLIGSDNKECKIQWFHIKYLLICQTIKDKWFHLKCKKQKFVQKNYQKMVKEM